MDIGKLHRLGEDDARKIWPTEDRHFSPWLAKNISHINDLLRISIDIEEREGPVERFKLDLSGTDRTSKRPVVIENQFGKSDHDHLGKLLTYAADREAGIVIWVANEIQLAHRRSIEWLNKSTPEDMSFYAVELELYKIDESRPAPYFRLAAGPPPSKRREITPTEEVSDRYRKYQKFFDELRNKILELQPNFTKAHGLPQSWWSVGIGRTGFSLLATFTIDREFRIEIYIDTGIKEANESALEQLEENRAHIEEEIGQTLSWDYLRDNRLSRVYASIEGSIDDDKAKLQQLIDWGAPTMIKFRKVFAPRIKNIDLGPST